jgi:hypothetical protein
MPSSSKQRKEIMNNAMTILKVSCVLSLLIAMTGCDAPEDEVVAGDTSEGFADEASTEITEDTEFRASFDVMEVRTCESGWPGHRVCEWYFGDGRPINEGSVNVFTIPHDGLGAWWHQDEVLDGNVLRVRVTMHEGDAFNPNSHIAFVSIAFNYL